METKNRRQVLQAAALAGGLSIFESACTSMTTTKTAAAATAGTRVAVLDDYSRVAEAGADWAVLNGRASVDFYHDHIFDEAGLVRRLAPYDIIVIERYRTPFPASLLSKLPKLKLLVSTTGA